MFTQEILTQGGLLSQGVLFSHEGLTPPREYSSPWKKKSFPLPWRTLSSSKTFSPPREFSSPIKFCQQSYFFFPFFEQLQSLETFTVGVMVFWDMGARFPLRRCREKFKSFPPSMKLLHECFAALITLRWLQVCIEHQVSANVRS